MNKVLTILLFIGFGSSAFAQTYQPSMQTLVNRYDFSPAYTGGHGNLEVFANYIQHNKGLGEGAVIKGVNINTAFLSNSGIGLKLNSDNIGAFEKFFAELDYAHHLNLKEKGALNFGLGVQVYHSQVNAQGFKSEGEDDVINAFTQQNETAINFAVGLSYYLKGFEVGFHVNPILDKGYENSYPRKIAVNLGYYHYFNHQFQIQPYLIIDKSTSSSISYQFNMMVKFLDSYWVNPSYRGNNTFGIGVGGILVDRFLLNYNYTLISNEPEEIATNSHEVVLGFLIKKKVRRGEFSPSIFNIKTKQPFNSWQ